MPFIEQKALGVVWACEKFHNYIIGMNTKIQTDHNLLAPLLNSSFHMEVQDAPNEVLVLHGAYLR